MTPREFFPSMPSDVFDMWLAPFIDNIGWPFRSLDDHLQNTRWKYILGGIPLSTWFYGRWELLDLAFDRVNIAGVTRIVLDQIVESANQQQPTAMLANLQDTQHRVRACASFIKKHGYIPKPIVGLIRGGELEILDGNHRIAALMLINGVGNLGFVKCWFFSPAHDG